MGVQPVNPYEFFDNATRREFTQAERMAHRCPVALFAGEAVDVVMLLSLLKAMIGQSADAMLEAGSESAVTALDVIACCDHLLDYPLGALKAQLDAAGSLDDFYMGDADDQ